MDNPEIYNIDGIHVEVSGSGADLLAVHGGPGLGLKSFLPDMRRATTFARLILYDQRGCGASAAADVDTILNIATHVQDLEKVRSSICGAAVTLMGHSFGAYLSMKYAIAHPGNVAGLILVSPTTPYPEPVERLRAWNSLWTADMRREMREILRSNLRREEAARRRLAVSLPLYFEQERGLKSFQDQQIQVPPALAESGGSVLMQDDLREQLDNLTMPVCIITGTEDRRTPLAISEELSSLLPNARVVKLERTGHFPFLERPRAFLDHLQKALHRSSGYDTSS